MQKIERSSLSGKNRKRIITSGLRYPTGITIDYATRRIYWLDGFLKKIEYADYEGNNRNSLQDKHLTYFSAPSYLTVRGAFVYWTDRGMVHTISKIPKEIGKRSGQTLFPLPETPFGITEFSVTRQKKGKALFLYYITIKFKTMAEDVHWGDRCKLAVLTAFILNNDSQKQACWFKNECVSNTIKDSYHWEEKTIFLVWTLSHIKHIIR